MPYRATATPAGIIALVLGCGYLFAGQLVVGRWSVEPIQGVLLLGRRMGAVYLGLALMLFLTRSAPPSPARSALALGAVVVLSLLAALGVCEFASGHAARGILVSAAVEFVLAVGFARTLIVDRRTLAA